MNVYLLYADKENASAGSYTDWNNISRDLGLNAIFKAAGIDSITRTGLGNEKKEHDAFLEHSVKRVMSIPLKTPEEVKYRQDILKDCITKQSMIDDLYQLSCDVLNEWERLGRKNSTGTDTRSKGKLITDIKVLNLLTNSMLKAQDIIRKNVETVFSDGIKNLHERMTNELNEKRTLDLLKLVDSLAFYSDISPEERERNQYILRSPVMQLEFSIREGLKMSDMQLDVLESEKISYNKQYGLGAKITDKISALAPGIISLQGDQSLQADAEALEYAVASYVYSYCGTLIKDFGEFFDQLHFQTAFYLGAVNIKNFMLNYKMDYSFPIVSEDEVLEFDELREFVLSMELKGNTIANSGKYKDKDLVIITGANQGGKSTFLRSIGVAQIMMQCGLYVSAKRFKTTIKPSVFTHFTRREDSAMNSGRLDEELRRMDRIVRNVSRDSLVLLNESFATTTEIEGSEIAYGIVRAFKENGVRVFTVTHLLSFAKRMYEEYKDDDSTVFLSAEHLDDGKRTFKMIPHAPEMTSFGLELYDQVLGE